MIGRRTAFGVCGVRRVDYRPTGPLTICVSTLFPASGCAISVSKPERAGSPANELKRIKSFCGTKPPRKLRWTDAGRRRPVVGYGDFTRDAGWRGCLLAPGGGDLRRSDAGWWSGAACSGGVLTSSGSWQRRSAALETAALCGVPEHARGHDRTAAAAGCGSRSHGLPPRERADEDQPSLVTVRTDPGFNRRRGCRLGLDGIGRRHRQFR